MLGESVESVLNQDYSDWEMILFDDGSTDGTQEIAKEYSDIHNGKIFYYEHENNRNFGTAYTRNRAVEKSKGEIIAFIDQDDIWYSDKLSYQMKIFDEMKNCAMIWGPSLYWYQNRTFIQPVGMNGEGIKSGVYNPPVFVDIFLNYFRGTPLPGASLLRRKYFDEVKGFEESIKGSEDIALWVKLAEKFNICYDDKVLVKYRKHADSTLRRASQSREMDDWNLIFYRWIIEFLKNKPGHENTFEIFNFSYYNCLKRIASRYGYIKSRKYLRKGLRDFPELEKKFSKDYLLDLILPFDVATRISSKLRFDLFKRK